MVNLKLNEIRILESLAKSPKRPTDLSEELDINKPNMSNYLRYLEGIGYIWWIPGERNERIYHYKEGL